MSKKLIVVGFGFMGQTHAQNIVQHPDLELAGIVDAIDPKIALKKSQGNVTTNRVDADVIASVPYYKDLGEAIAAVKPDAVVIATPTMLHYKFAKITLEAGCNLFLEKPICLDPNLCDELVALAESKHLVFMAGHCVRFQKEFQYIKELVEKQTYGKPVYFHYSRYCGVPGWGCWTDPEVSAKSGGAMYDMAIHDTDCARALFGNPDEISVMPYLRDRFGLMVVDTCWKYNNGPIVRVEAGFLAPHTMPFHKEFTAIFEKATINSDMRGMTISTEEGVKPVTLEEVDCYAAEMGAFAEYLKKGEMPLECSGKDATATIRICTRFFNNKG